MQPDNAHGKRIGILVVHGVGEQACFDFLEDVATNLYLALSKDPERKPHVQISRGDQVPVHSPNESWREAPAIVSWWSPASQRWLEAHFREVHWADLDMPATFRNWLDLVGWALGMSGVRLFSHSEVWAGRQPFMHLPRGLTWRELITVRVQLFGLSLLFLFMVTSIGLLYFLFTRFSSQARWFKLILGVIYDYLGDVKLYQDWFLRTDYLEAIGERSRVSIRRRMVRALLRMAADVEAEGPSKKLDEYYILSHSLGTVVAFNALMELDVTLPNYLTREEWDGLPGMLKTRLRDRAAPPKEQPRRPPWLDRQDAINRTRLFAGLRGFVTLGSPLDKFAALWRIIVPINNDAIPGRVPWVNVADCQDIVASSLDLFAQGSDVGGLRLLNVEWADQPTLVTAHTSYWKAGRRQERFINRFIAWLERSDERGEEHMAAPENCCPRWLAKGVYAMSLTVLSGTALVATTVIVWASLEYLLHKPVSWFPLVSWWSFVLPRELESWPGVLLTLSVFGLGVIVVAVLSIVRYVGEMLTINPIKRTVAGP